MNVRPYIRSSLLVRRPWRSAGEVMAEAAVATIDGAPTHDPPLQPRDEATFLLTAAAEIEHALMVQYLYAAFSLRPLTGDPNFARIKAIQETLIQIAREEMGHLITVQNLLTLIGAPLNFGREHSPYASQIYPFRFKLEPVTTHSLAKYVVAESPAELPPDFTEDDRRLLEETIEPEADAANDGHPVQHVGPIFARLEMLFRDSVSGLGDPDFIHGGDRRQGLYADWGYDAEGQQQGERLIIDAFDGADVGALRTAATNAIKAIGGQGEGFDPSPAGMESHFERFFKIYRDFGALVTAGAQPTWLLPTNPNTSPQPDASAASELMPEAMIAAHEEQGRITHPRARSWAQLFNLRYRLLLGMLSHFLRLEQDLYEGPGPRRGDRTARGLLLIWTFDEMRRLKKIAGKLVQLPKDAEPGELHAGPPFELPYTLLLPDREADRWRAHLDVLKAALALVRRIQAADPQDGADEFLADLVRLDQNAEGVIAALAAGEPLPDQARSTDFQKVVRILEEAVRGFTIGVHRNFWDRKTRDMFVAHPVSGTPVIRQNPDGTFDPAGSPLVRRIEGAGVPRMPRHRPAIPPERIGFVRDWIGQGCSDNDPPGQLGLERERDPREETAAPPEPPPTRPLSFEADIKGLFRDRDRNAMRQIAGFDLHNLDDVREHATSILARVSDGTMPCDMSWPPERVAKFKEWIDDGKQP